MSYIQQFFTSRDNNANAETFVGQEGRLWWNPLTNQIYSSDGNTPGGIPLAGGGGGNGSPGGINGQVQFNDLNAFGGSANLTFDSGNGTLTAVNFVGNGSGLNSITGGNIVGEVAYAAIANSVAGANVSGTVANATYAVSAGSATSATTAGTVITNAQPNITSVGTLTSITSTGNISTTGNVTGNYFVGNGSQLTGISTSSNRIFNGTSNVEIATANSNVTITTAGAATWTFNTAGNVVFPDTTVQTTAYPGTDTTLSLTGNIGAGNVSVSGAFYGNFYAPGVDTQVVFNDNNFANADAGFTYNKTTETVAVGNAVSASNVSVTNTISGNVISATGNVTAANVIVNGTAAAGSAVLIVSGNIQTTTANNTANIGNVSNYFNTVHAKATTAQYADVAELYLADTQYLAGTVLVFGGDQEVTALHQSHDSAIAGVVSENPSHLMNAGLQGVYAVPVALLGRVKCQVQGTINKGDRLVASSTPGVAQRLDPSQYQPGCIIGKSLENYNSNATGMIEIAVGIK